MGVFGPRPVVYLASQTGGKSFNQLVTMMGVFPLSATPLYSYRSVCVADPVCRRLIIISSLSLSQRTTLLIAACMIVCCATVRYRYTRIRRDLFAWTLPHYLRSGQRLLVSATDSAAALWEELWDCLVTVFWKRDAVKSNATPSKVQWKESVCLCIVAAEQVPWGLLWMWCSIAHCVC